MGYLAIGEEKVFKVTPFDSGSTSSMIGILLLSLHLIKLRYAAKLKFVVTNNVVEYKTLLMALRIINQLGATKVEIFCDSQLMVNQY